MQQLDDSDKQINKHLSEQFIAEWRIGQHHRTPPRSAVTRQGGGDREVTPQPDHQEAAYCEDPGQV